MKIQFQCPYCHTLYMFDDKKVPDSGDIIKCKKCDNEFFIKKDSGEAEEKPKIQEELKPEEEPKKNSGICPKCGYNREPNDSECLKCGIIYEKYKGNIKIQIKEADERKDYNIIIKIEEMFRKYRSKFKLILLGIIILYFIALSLRWGRESFIFSAVIFSIFFFVIKQHIYLNTPKGTAKIEKMKKKLKLQTKYAKVTVHAGDFLKGEGYFGFDSFVLNATKDNVSGEEIPSTQLESVTVASEESVKDFGGSLIAGAAGAFFLGPIGLLAGALSGGQKKEVTFIAIFKDGRKLLATTDGGTYTKLLSAVF